MPAIHQAAVLALLALWVGCSKKPEPPVAVPPRHVQGLEPISASFPKRTVLSRRLRSGLDQDERTVLFVITRGSDRFADDERDDFWPAVVVLADGEWRAISFDQDLARREWVHAAAAPSKGFFWGFLDYAVEGRSQALAVVFSDDQGKTWEILPSVPKPVPDATFDSFRMGEGGAGTLTMVVEGEQSPMRREIYTVATQDWGRTWAEPRRSAEDVLVDAEAAGDGPGLCLAALKRSPLVVPEGCRLPEDVKPGAK